MTINHAKEFLEVRSLWCWSFFNFWLKLLILGLIIANQLSGFEFHLGHLKFCLPLYAAKKKKKPKQGLLT